MSKTEKLYYQDSHLYTFTARVQRCAPVEDGFATVLDQTAFYPEGGGQPADRGILNDISVTDVHEQDGTIIHITDAFIEPGTTIAGNVDKDYRLTNMQQHSGEHIVSGIAYELFGYDNVGFHIGREMTTLDFNGELNEESLTRIEIQANEAVFSNIPLKIYFPPAEELRSLSYRSKKELSGLVRIVSVPGIDQCACCGTHVQSTGEIGLIKIISAQRYKGGTRIAILCGKRALADYTAKQKSVSEISILLSAKTGEVSGAVQKLLDEAANLRQKISIMQNMLHNFKISAIRTEEKNIFTFEEDMPPEELRDYCNALCGWFIKALVFSGNDEAGYRYALGSNSEDMRPLCKELNTAFNGRGGGKSELAQGALQGMKKDIERFLRGRGYAST